MTDFKAWLDQYEPSTGEEAFQLYHALTNEESVGIYEVKRSGQQLHCRVGNGDWLILASDKAITAFKKEIARLT